MEAAATLIAHFTSSADHRSVDAGHDGALADPDHRLQDGAGRLPEDPVHPRVPGGRQPVPAAAHPAAGGAGGAGELWDLVLGRRPVLQALPASRSHLCGLITVSCLI